MKKAYTRSFFMNDGQAIKVPTVIFYSGIISAGPGGRVRGYS